MNKGKIIKLMGISVSVFHYYLRMGVVPSWPCNCTKMTEKELEGYISECLNSIEEYKRQPSKPYVMKHTDWSLPKIYKEYEKNPEAFVLDN